jgi:hypothetical protein
MTGSLLWFLLALLLGGLVWSYVKQVEVLNEKLRKLDFKVSMMGRFIMDNKEDEL